MYWKALYMSLKRLFSPSSAIDIRPLSSFSCWNFCSCVSFGLAASAYAASASSCAYASTERDMDKAPADDGRAAAAAAIALSFFEYHSASPWTLLSFSLCCEVTVAMLASDTIRRIRDGVLDKLGSGWPYALPGLPPSDAIDPMLAMLALP